MDRGAWWAAFHRVAQSRTRLKLLSMHACIGEGNGSPLQCSCLENPRDGGAWWAAVYGVAQSRTRLKRLSSSSGTCRAATRVWGLEADTLGSCLSNTIFHPEVTPGKFLHLPDLQLLHSLKWQAFLWLYP